jgi:hypothetical protein
VKEDQMIHKRAIAAYLACKVLLAWTIHVDLVATFGFDAMVYSHVMHDLRETCFPPEDLSRFLSRMVNGNDNVDEVMIVALAESCFVSVR